LDGSAFREDPLAALEDTSDEDGDPAVVVVVAAQPPRCPRPITGRFTDVGDPDTLRWLAERLPEVLVSVRCPRLHLPAATGPHRELIKASAGEPHLHGDIRELQDPSRYGKAIRCPAAFETVGDLPGVAPDGSDNGPSIQTDDHALERAMRLHRLAWEL
jgi:hypothetical protein